MNVIEAFVSMSTLECMEQLGAFHLQDSMFPHEVK